MMASSISFPSECFQTFLQNPYNLFIHVLLDKKHGIVDEISLKNMMPADT
jgi:hypothetical protein